MDENNNQPQNLGANPNIGNPPVQPADANIQPQVVSPEVTGPQIEQQGTVIQSNNTYMKEKPPVAAQILYALGFIGLIFGLLGSIAIFLGSSDTTSYGALFGISSLNNQITAILFGIIVIAGFTLINFIRGGKKWALITYTAISTIGFLATLIGYQTMSDFERARINASPISSFAPFAIIALLLVVLWSKNRAYFK